MILNTIIFIIPYHLYCHIGAAAAERERIKEKKREERYRNRSKGALIKNSITKPPMKDMVSSGSLDVMLDASGKNAFDSIESGFEKAGFNRIETVEPKKDKNEIIGVLPANRDKPYNTMEVIERLVDNSDFEEYKKGTLEVGKFADMVLLSEDLLSIDPERIMEVDVEKTWIGGSLVYELDVLNRTAP